MNAEPIARAKEVRDDGSVVEIVIWRLAQPLEPCTHRHVNNVEEPYRFESLARLLDDFQHDVETWS